MKYFFISNPTLLISLAAIVRILTEAKIKILLNTEFSYKVVLWDKTFNFSSAPDRLIHVNITAHCHDQNNTHI